MLMAEENPMALKKMRSLGKLGVATLYIVSASGTVFLNKVLTTQYGFKMHMMLTAIQSAVIMLVIPVTGLVSVDKLRLRTITRWLPVSIVLSVMIGTNMKVIYYFPVNLVSLYKNTSIILVALFESFLMGGRISALQYLGLLIIVLSAYNGKLVERIQFAGYIWLVANILSTAGYVILQKMTLVRIAESRNSEASEVLPAKDKSILSLESAFITNMLAVPVMLVCSLFLDRRIEYTLRMDVYLLIVLSGLSALLTSLSSAWTLLCFKSTTHSVMGATSKILLGLMGIVVLKESASVLRIFAILLGVSGTLVYGLASQRAKAE